jgi:hypothetical protein
VFGRSRTIGEAVLSAVHGLNVRAREDLCLMAHASAGGEAEMTVSAVTAGSSAAAVVGVGAGQVTDPGAGVSTAASALAFTGAPHLALEGFVGALFVMTGALLVGLARRHRRQPAVVPVVEREAERGQDPFQT